MNEKKDSQKMDPFRKKLLIGGATVLVVVALVAAYRLGVGSRVTVIEADPVAGGRGVVAVPENVDELREKAQQPVEDGYYETRMNVEWEFPGPGEASTNAYVENSTNNKRTVYFDLVLRETNELIYSSPFIPVGAKLEKFKLDAEIPRGEHRGIVTYHLVDDDHKELTTVSVAVTLRVG
jgi:hypothetical protein